MSNPTVNLAIQILPMSIEKSKAYAGVDQAISVLDASGLTYKVCPFETVIEGTYDEIMKVIKDMQDAVLASYAEHILVNIKIQRTRDTDIRISDKIAKYE